MEILEKDRAIRTDEDMHEEVEFIHKELSEYGVEDYEEVLNAFEIENDSE